MRAAALARIVLVLVLAAACTRQVGVGERCEKLEQCGLGHDCYHGVCTPLCADDSECDARLVCARHHCLMATGEPQTADKQKPTTDNRQPTTEHRTPRADDRAPSTDSTKTEASRPGLREPATEPHDFAGELRGIHEEIDALRKEQQRLQEAVESLRKSR